MFGMQARRAADHHQVKRLMLKKLLQASASLAAEALREVRRVFLVLTVDGRDLDAIRDLTDRPFAVNHVPQTLDESAFAATLRLRPAVISFALGDPGDRARVGVERLAVGQRIRGRLDQGQSRLDETKAWH